MPRTRANHSLTPGVLRPILATLKAANVRLTRDYPGDATDRQPVHTFYGGAHLFKADSVRRLGGVALSALDEYAPDAAALARVFGLAPELAEIVRRRVASKLRREPIEDFRIDFEDGYGVRSHAEEDTHARTAAEEVAAAMATDSLPPLIGIRIKPMSTELHARGLRTLDLFVSTLASSAHRQLPPNFVVTVPKLMGPGHVAAVARACGAIERKLRLTPDAIRLEIMIETPQSILSADGSSALRALVAAGGGRVRGAHFGTYDYTALCGITASAQHMRHPACDFAKQMMQVALAQSGVWLSDGATTTMPIAPHKVSPGSALTDSQRKQNRDVVHRAWRLHFDDTQHSLATGFYQGWDLHPAQLPARYAAVYAFFQTARPAAAVRLRNFVEKAAQATLVGDVFDDAATGQGLLNFFVRGVSSGALTLDDAAETGLTRDELQSRSFLEILEGRRQ
jgi:citrate lyase beta subunit